MRREQRLAIRRLLLACVGTDLEVDPAAIVAAARQISAETWAEVPRIAVLHGVVLHVRAALSEVDAVPPATQDTLRSHSHALVAKHAQALAAIYSLTPLLHDITSGCWAVFKGPVLNDTVYRIPGRRTYGDLDILVPPSAVRGILTALERGGGKLTTRNWELIEKRGRAEISIRLTHGIDLDLHWDLLGAPPTLPQIDLDSSGALRRARTVTLGGSDHTSEITARTLSTCDQLLHLAVHAVRSGFPTLHFCLDIDQAIRHDPPDYQDFARRAEESASTLLVEVALDRTFRTLPGPLSRKWRIHSHRAWATAMRAHAHMNSPLRAHEARMPLLAVGATQDSTLRSVRDLIEQTGPRLTAARDPYRLIGRLRGQPLPPSQPDPLAEFVDGGRREAFLSRLDRM